jgi:uncharacterized protein YhaN
MRLLDLTLDCYGPFNGLRLNFDPDAQVHIVYGANEAGKSSALAALGDLFYGAPRRTITFLRPKDMRVGATLRGRNGQILQFFRRRGDKNTLLDASGAVLPDDTLAPFLGAATREIFDRAFGLDARNLREGGNDMLRADGEIGASLFAAASGLRGLLELRAGLDAEAEKVFDDRRAGHRAFYQALDRFDAARKLEKEALVSESTLKALSEAIDSASEQLAEIEQDEKAAQAEALRLERLRKAAPILRRLALLRAQSAQYDDLAAISAEQARRLAELLAARDSAREKAEQALKMREAARQERDAAAPDSDLLAAAGKIEDLIRASGAYEKSTADLPRREKALREARQSLDLRAQSCGLPGLEELRAALPDAAALLRAEKLVARGRDLSARKDQPERALSEEEGRLAALSAQPQDVLPEAEALREKLRAFGEVESLDVAFRDISRACIDDSRALDEKCARLSPALADLDQFARSPSPDAAAIARTARVFEDFSAREAKARAKAQEAEAQIIAAVTRLRALELQGPVASLAALRGARARRDEEWFALRDLVSGDGPADPARARDKARLFESLAAEADRSADSLLANAAQAAAAEAEREKIVAAKTDKERADTALAALAEEDARLQAEWSESWRASGVKPAAPREMSLWRGKADQLIEDRDVLRRDQARVEELRGALARIVPGLQALAAECGLAAMDLDAGALARRIAARVGEIAKAQAAAREARARLADAPERIAKLKAQLTLFAEEEKAWRGDWRPALAALRLDPDAGFEEAQARIAFWRALPGELRDEQELETRVEAIRKDIAGFEQSLDVLLALCARDIPSRPVEDAAAQLRTRLTQAREKAVLRARAEQALVDGNEAARLADVARAEAEGELQSLCTRFGFACEPDQLASRLAAREAAALAIGAECGGLALVAEGHDEETLTREAENFDADAALIRLGAIERQSDERKTRAREVFAEQRARQNELARLQQSAGAETAIFQRESARAEIAEQSRRWAVLKLAGLLVSAGLEKRRSQRQDPLLKRAGELFAGLTEGRYAGLGQDFGEDDRLHLRARRSDGAALELAALSEGARDQLYLALRLAFLEDYAARSEAPPLVGDDLFASFDDSRAAAGFRALAAAGATIQPILFTHHAHILGVAEDVLGPRAQILRLDPVNA